jgi:hypothetical protein
MQTTAIAQRRARSARNSTSCKPRAGSITTLRHRRILLAREVTADQLGEFGFFSGLRAYVRADIIIARFDRTVLIGT